MSVLASSWGRRHRLTLLQFRFVTFLAFSMAIVIRRGCGAGCGSVWQATIIPVGTRIMLIALSVLLRAAAGTTREGSTFRSRIPDLDLDGVVDHRIHHLLAKLVCRRALELNGLIRTSRCTPASVSSQP